MLSRHKPQLKPLRKTGLTRPFVSFLKANKQELLLAGALSFAIIGLLTVWIEDSIQRGGFGALFFANPYLPDTSLWRFLVIGASAGAGFLCGWFISDKAKRTRFVVWLTFLTVISFAIYVDNGSIGWSLASFAAIAAFLGAFGFWAARFVRHLTGAPTALGSAHWATTEKLESEGYFQGNGLYLGEFPKGDGFVQMTYPGHRHIITCAPTQYGKGTTAIIPNLLTYTGSMVVIDPKGENALVTARHRQAMGQEVFVVDPWGITGMKSSRFNPLDWLKRGDVDVAENGMVLADAIIQTVSQKEPFFDEEAKGMLHGDILNVATDKAFEGQRTLGTVRDMLLLNGEALTRKYKRMLHSPHYVVRSVAARALQKEERLLSNVLASVQAQTHFLDSPRLRESLAHSDFTFEDLKTKKMTVYLVLPSDRLGTFGRWLRLLIQQALTVNARNIESRPRKPVLFVLDEMAALGRLSMVEQAFGLMAGYGIQLWGIVQDLSQVKRVYGDGWETFMSNAGVIQYFGSRDVMTAEYFSKLCGVTTVWNVSTAISRAFGSSSGQGGATTSNTKTTTDTASGTQRRLAYADELMRMHKKRQLLIVENTDPIAAFRKPWFEEASLKHLGVDLHAPQQKHPVLGHMWHVKSTSRQSPTDDI